MAATHFPSGGRPTCFDFSRIKRQLRAKVSASVARLQRLVNLIRMARTAKSKLAGHSFVSYEQLSDLRGLPPSGPKTSLTSFKAEG